MEEDNRVFHVLNKGKTYMYRDMIEFLVSNNLSILVMTSLISDLKIFLKQEEKIGGLYSHQSDGAHSDIYNITLDIIKYMAEMNIAAAEQKPFQTNNINKIGDFSVSFPKYDKLLELHKHSVGGTYVDSPSMFDFEFVYNIDTASKMFFDIKEYETTSSRNAQYIQTKPTYTEADVKNTIFPLYNYLFNNEFLFKM